MYQCSCLATDTCHHVTITSQGTTYVSELRVVVLHEAWHMCQKYAQLCCTRHDICFRTTCSRAARGMTCQKYAQLCCTRHDICVWTTCKLCCMRHDICVRSMHSCAAQGMTYVSELRAVVLYEAWHMCQKHHSCAAHHVNQFLPITKHDARWLYDK